MTKTDKAHYYRNLGSWARSRRIALGMTQDVVGDLLGCTRVTICNIEAGRQAVTAHMLREFELVFEERLED